MWDRLIDQERVKMSLRRGLDSGRVAHAYLFSGPYGVGKRLAALAFAQALQCKKGGTEGCGTCLDCRKVRRLIHPDVHVLFPTPNDAGMEDIAERLQKLADNPYATVDFVRRPSLSDPARISNKQAQYSVSRVHEELLHTLSYKPVEGRYKIAVVTDAELFNVKAANAFLKLLEEPAPRTVFLLTTTRLDQVLPTIVSRCQRLRFDLLTPGAIEERLRADAVVPFEEAAAIARMADGSYSRALDLAENEDLLGTRQLVLDFLRHAYLRSGDRLVDLVEMISKVGREQIKGLFKLLLSWLRDLLLYRTMGNALSLVNIDQAEAVAKFCNKLPKADLEAMINLVEEAADLVERNVHTGLLVTALANALGRAMRGPHSGRLYLPLVEDVGVATLS